MNRLCFLLIIATLCGCATFKDFSQKNDTLVVGQLVINVNNPKSLGVNGRHTIGIDIIIENHDRKIIRISARTGIPISVEYVDSSIRTSTQDDGLFLFENLQEGTYRLIRTEFVQDRANAKLYSGGPINRYFIVNKEKVNNLGVIIQSIEENNYTVKSGNYEVVKNLFSNKYPKLQWNNVDWIDAVLTNDLPIFFDEEYEKYNENWDIVLLDTARDVDYLTTTEKNIILEINKVRSDPQKYADLYIKPMLGYFEDYIYREPGKERKITQEGIISVEECYNVLSNMQDVGILKPEKGLSLGARDHVKDIGVIGVTGHTGTDGSRPADRIMRHMRGDSLLEGFVINENIAYSHNSSHEIIVALLIDDGEPERGHRNSMLHPLFREIGVATGVHKRYGTMCVIEFANGYKSY